jgi:GIY-YIG catalytic domain
MNSEIKVINMYRIVCKDPIDTNCYIGSTENFPRRKNNHYNNCIKNNNKEYNKYVYQYIRENGGFDNWDIIEIEKYNPVDLEDRRRRERYWLEYYNASLNKNTPFTTTEEKLEQRRRLTNEWLKNPENVEKQRIKMNEWHKNPENAEKNRVRNKEHQRIKTGYYEKHSLNIIKTNSILI